MIMGTKYKFNVTGCAFTERFKLGFQIHLGKALYFIVELAYMGMGVQTKKMMKSALTPCALGLLCIGSHFLTRYLRANA